METKKIILKLRTERGMSQDELANKVMVGTWITHLFGGSAGREGVAVQIGATLSHYLGRKMKTPDNSKVMLITGMAAGFGGLFQTPLAATFFAMEVIVAGYMDYQALLPAIIGAFVASYTSHFLGLEKFAVELKGTVDFSNIKIVVAVIILGLAFGIVGRIFSTSLCGLGITCVATSSPSLDAAALPLSTAALTAPTSPRTITVTSPDPIFSVPTSATSAAFVIASAASIAAVSPLVSTIPKASCAMKSEAKRS
mgnify:CR=1 FL=1